MIDTRSTFLGFSTRTSTRLALPFAMVLAACGGDDAPGTLPQPSATVAVPAPPPSVAPAKRTLVDGKLVSTPTQNLLLDPGFSLTEQGQQGAGTFLAFYESGGQLEVKTRVDSTSPSGFGGGVATLKDPKATDVKSRSIQLIASFTGGKGPFVAKVWVSSIDAGGAPRPFPEDQGGFEAVLVDAKQSNAGNLKIDPEQTKIVGSRTWVLYTGQLKKDLVGGGLMVVTTGNKGGGFELSAPEIVATPTLAATSLGRGHVMGSRALTAGERASIAAYAAIPRRLVPASPGERAPHPGVPAKKK